LSKTLSRGMHREWSCYDNDADDNGLADDDHDDKDYDDDDENISTEREKCT